MFNCISEFGFPYAAQKSSPVPDLAKQLHAGPCDTAKHARKPDSLFLDDTSFHGLLQPDP